MSAKPTGGNGHSRLEDVGDLRRYLLGQMSEGEEARVERAYLASDEAKFVTGSELVIDGGYTAR